MEFKISVCSSPNKIREIQGPRRQLQGPAKRRLSELHHHLTFNILLLSDTTRITEVSHLLSLGLLCSCSSKSIFSHDFSVRGAGATLSINVLIGGDALATIVRANKASTGGLPWTGLQRASFP